MLIMLFMLRTNLVVYSMIFVLLFRISPQEAVIKLEFCINLACVVKIQILNTIYSFKS